MKISHLILVSVIVLCMFSILNAQNNEGEKIYQEGLFHMEGMGNYAEAIGKFEKIAREYADDESLAARALLMMGKCHEKLGRQEAKEAYNRIIENYSDQREVALEARSRLLALTERSQSKSPSGMVVRQVWAGPDVDNLGSPSPDEKFLSFVDWSTGDLAIRDLSAGENHRLTDKGSWFESDEHALFSIFSPDGKYIAYAWWNDERHIYDLRIIDIETKDVRVLFADEDIGYVQPYDWSPGGETIVMILSRNDQTNQLGLVSVYDSSLSILKSLDWRYPENMSFSPDERFIAYDFPPFEEKDERNIYLIDLKHQRESVLMGHQSENIVFSWTPGGDHLLFKSDRTGSWGIWILPVNDGKAAGQPKLLKSDLGQNVMPMRFTENGTLYYGLTTGGRDVYTAPLDFENDAPFDNPERISQRYIGMNRTPDWSPDGKYIAYSSTRDQRRSFRSNTVVIYSVETGQERTLTPDLNYIFDRTRWSPDGESIVVTGADRRNRRGLYVINTTSGEITEVIVSDPFTYLRQPEFSPDGKYLYYFINHFQERISTLIQRNIESGKETELYSVSLQEKFPSALIISSNSEFLAFREAEGDKSRLKMIRLNSKESEIRTLLTTKRPESIRDILSFREDEILFGKAREISDEETVRELWVVDINNGNNRKLGVLPNENNINNIRLHPDGKTAVFNMGPRNKPEIWAIDNLLPEGDVAGK